MRTFPFDFDYGPDDTIPAILVEPCEFCASEEPCPCKVRGVIRRLARCRCTCGRCRYPGPLPDAEPPAPPPRRELGP